MFGGGRGLETLETPEALAQLQENDNTTQSTTQSDYWKRKVTMSAGKMYSKAEAPCCDVKEVHEDKVRFVNENMPPEDKLYDLAELFKAFGDSTRIRILFALFEAEICVCDLAETLNMAQSAVSHQLRLLKQARLVSGRREGKQIIYYLADDHVRTIISMGLEHINE